MAAEHAINVVHKSKHYYDMRIWVIMIMTFMQITIETVCKQSKTVLCGGQKNRRKKEVAFAAA